LVALTRGFEGLALQRQHTEQGRAEHIVFVGGQDNIRIGIETIKRGAVDFLLKPFRDDELISAVAQALARSAEAVEIRARLSKLTPKEFVVDLLMVALKAGIAPAPMGISLSQSRLYSSPLRGINNSPTLTNRLAKTRPVAS